MGPHSPATHSIKAFVLEKVKAPPTSPAAYENGHPILSAADCLARESESESESKSFDASGHMVRERESQRENARGRESARERESERERAREREQRPNVHSGQTCTQQSCTKTERTSIKPCTQT